MRQPVISIPGRQTTKVYGEEIACSREALLLAIAEKLELPGFGPNGFGEGIPCVRPEDLSLKQVADTRRKTARIPSLKRVAKDCASSWTRGGICPQASSMLTSGRPLSAVRNHIGEEIDL